MKPTRCVLLAVIAAVLVGQFSGCGSSAPRSLPEADQVDQIVAEVKVSPTGYPWRTGSRGFALPHGYAPRVLAAMTQDPSPLRSSDESSRRIWGILEFVLKDGHRIKVYLLGSSSRRALYSIGDTSRANRMQGGSQAGLERVLRDAYKVVNPERFKNIIELPANQRPTDAEGKRQPSEARDGPEATDDKSDHQPDKDVSEPSSEQPIVDSQAQAAAIAVIEHVGGKVERDPQLAGQPVVYIDFYRNKRVTNADLATLEAFTQIRKLRLSHTRISDDGLMHLKGLRQLETVYFENNPITDAGLDHLRELPNLRELGLSGTKVTLDGLLRLDEFPKIQVLFLRRLGLSRTNVDKLQQALPDCAIHVQGR